ncbi:MAG: Deoxyribose-phosphate aldolase [Fimbriimonadaceae bacterium]|nr:Deoxyribose-phosphate aldolase [Fimbriimonadaceae bacterium]
MHSALEPHHQDARNPGIPFNRDWVAEVRINRSAVERRAATIPKRRTVKKSHQAAWLLRAIRCLDLTTLAGDDTPDRVARLCAKALMPFRMELAEALGVDVAKYRPAAVCVYHEMIEPARRALAGSDVKVAAVSTGFPAGLSPLKLRIAEVEASVEAGAQEIDVVISRRHVLRGEWEALYDEVQQFREACGPAHLKVILGVGDLGNLREVGQASLVAMMAGADFIKTSTGKETVNATLPVGLVMARAIRDYHDSTGRSVGFKPAGGIRTAKQATDWLILMFEELGEAWTRPELFRLGASSLLNDVERQLDHFAFDRYAASWKQPLP